MGQVLCISQVSQHVLQLGPVWPYLTSQVNSVTKQTYSDGEWREKTKQHENILLKNCEYKLKKKKRTYNKNGRKAALKGKKVN